jgi:hypothetical protein
MGVRYWVGGELHWSARILAPFDITFSCATSGISGAPRDHPEVAIPPSLFWIGLYANDTVLVLPGINFKRC